MKCLPSPVSGETFKIGEGLYVSKDEWLTYTEDGCMICGTDIKQIDHDNLGWSIMIVNGDETLYCPTCPTCKHMYGGNVPPIVSGTEN